MAVEYSDWGVLDKGWKYSHSCNLTDVVDIACQFRGKKHFVKAMGSLGVEEVRLHLHLKLLHHLGYVAVHGLVVTSRLVHHTVCVAIDCSVIMSHNNLQDWKDRFHSKGEQLVNDIVRGLHERAAMTESCSDNFVQLSRSELVVKYGLFCLACSFAFGALNWCIFLQCFSKMVLSFKVDKSEEGGQV